MLRFLLRKISYGILVLLGVVALVFFLFNVLPGDPARLTLGQRADVASLENVRKELHLDKPVAVQFLLYLNDLSPISVHSGEEAERVLHFVPLLHLSGDRLLVLKTPYLRRSYQGKKDVWEMLTEALPGTLVLAVAAILFATVAGIGLGILSAVKKDTWMDTGAVFASVVGISAPSFFMGIVLAYLFGFVLSDYTGLHMTGSLFDYDAFSGWTLTLRNLVLPAVTLGIRPLAIIVQLTRGAMLDVLHQDYIRTAYAKGLPKWAVIFRHALRNALNPVVTAITGWFAELLAGAFFVEYIFGWKGIGKMTVDALEKFDFPVLMGAVLFTAGIFVVINLLADLLYSVIDPRIKL
ncbi:ABC transporter permease [Chitinophaga sancti]|uniref:ABC transporter permease n=1 Tax=Chitinophaga sancti TaxID=1004 RepID=A0A1K1MM50_9BACT|nr:ABC transporter permease [Chitinophaga sancti]WQD62724.1 ABC transporter permease [Chitinophaga sancti]WQG91652.1 ABC transporter permease [Chitinophaga sancti]SFW23014.1 peptide/nickel transport system permease protein [Chitinophaga sancti]